MVIIEQNLKEFQPIQGNPEEYFRELKARGEDSFRLPLTWEALEGREPGLYNEEYMAILRKFLLEAEKQGISVMMAPDQDHWCRWTGGNGAPAWTLELAGMDIDRLNIAVAEQKYAAATLFSLFFGGNTYAPGLKAGEDSIQDRLQEGYIAAMRHCFRRLKNCRALKGWGIMGGAKPHFIGYSAPGAYLAPAYRPGAAKVSIFKPGYTDPWKGCQPDHFALFQGRKADFDKDFFQPFAEKYMARMREVNEGIEFF
ncbi:hypothetical protein AGMMS49928_17910 [Spirochaetia bacterium]|nr:hypothetical protein AGMMS49928_17910 [Spirochaetia bacterium]